MSNNIKITKESGRLIKWLISHPLISIYALEKECGIYPRDLDKAIKGVRGIPEKYEEPLINILKKYGYK